MEHESLWHSIILSRYGVDPTSWDYNQVLPPHSLSQKNIIEVGHLFYPYTWFAIGNGSKVIFWKDLWWGSSTLESSYSRIFHIVSHKNALVSEILSQNMDGLSWNLAFTRDLYEWEAPLVGKSMDDLHLIYISSEDDDTRIWSPFLDGSFSSKSFFLTLAENCFSPSQFMAHKIQNSVAPPRVKAFNWVIS